MLAVLFYSFAALAVISALCVILLPRPTRALLSLIVAMFALAVIYVLLGAYFVAMANIIVYAGAVLVVFLFVIMLQGIGAQEIPLKERFSKVYTLLAGFTGIAFLISTAILIAGIEFPQAAGFSGTIETVGLKLFSNYLIPFELTSLLLLVGVFAAISLAKPEASK